MTVASPTVEHLGDLGVGEAAREQLEDLALALGQLGERAGRGRRARRQPPPDAVEQPARHRRGEQRVAGGDHPHGVHQLRGRHVLEDEAARPGPQRLDDVLVEPEGGQDQDAVPGQPPRRLDPVEQRHADVHQHDVGAQRARELDRLLAVAGLADDLHLAGRLEHRAEARAHQRLVVGDQQAQPVLTAAAPRAPRSRGRRCAPPGLERAAEQRDALAHADEPVLRACAVAARPAPSSTTDSSSASARSARGTSVRSARACLITLVSASWTIR